MNEINERDWQGKNRGRKMNKWENKNERERKYEREKKKYEREKDRQREGGKNVTSYILAPDSIPALLSFLLPIVIYSEGKHTLHGTKPKLNHLWDGSLFSFREERKREESRKERKKRRRQIERERKWLTLLWSDNEFVTLDSCCWGTSILPSSFKHNKMLGGK